MWLPVGRLRQRQSWDGGLDPVGEQGALGPLPQGLSPLQPHARLGPRPSSGQQARSPAPTQVPAAGCPAGGSCQGWPPPWAPPAVFQGPRDPSAPRGAFPRWPPAELAPSPRSGGSLSRFFPGYSGPQASGPAPGASRPPGQGPGPILSGLAGPHPRTCLEPQGALLGRGVGGSWGRAAARPPFMSPSPLGSLWAAFVSSFQPDPQASPSPGFSGVEERAREGGGLCWRETRPHPETCRWAPARRGFKEAEPAPGSHPCRPGPRLEERRLCQPVTQTLGLGSDPSPVVPACSSPPGCCPDPAPIRCCPLLPPTPTAGTPGWSRHMPFLFSGPWSWNSHAAQGH